VSVGESAPKVNYEREARQIHRVTICRKWWAAAGIAITQWSGLPYWRERQLNAAARDEDVIMERSARSYKKS